MPDGGPQARQTWLKRRGFLSFLDAVAPDHALPFQQVRLAGETIIPALLRPLHARELHLMVNRDCASVETLQSTSGGRTQRLIHAPDAQIRPDGGESVVMALARGDEVLGWVASRMIWCERTLAEEMESGRFWGRHPLTPGFGLERCVVHAANAQAIESCPVACVASLHLDRIAIDETAAEALLRLHHLWALCHWRWSWMIALVEAAVARGQPACIVGAADVDSNVWRAQPGGALRRQALLSCPRATAMAAWIRPETANLRRPMGFAARRVKPASRAVPPRHWAA